MGKVTFGEYAGFITKNQVRFMKNNRLTSEKNVPVEVVNFIRKKLKVEDFVSPEIKEVAEMLPEVVNNTTEEPQSLELEPNPPQVDPDFLESVSVHTADLQTIAEALYQRFGIYSVYLGDMPRIDEINPLTGEVFTKYHLGVAYQAAIRARTTGVLNKRPEEGRVAIDTGREAAKNLKESFIPLPKTLGEAKEQDSFSYRTSVRGSSGYGQASSKGELVNVQGEDGTVRVERVSPEDVSQGKSPSGMISVMPDGRFDLDEPLAEPPFRGEKIIRPDW
jgi:hypothetical protein